MINPAGSIAFLMRCYYLPTPNGVEGCTLAHARSNSMSDWLRRFKRQGLIHPDVTIDSLIRGDVTMNYLTDKGVAFVKAICELKSE